MTEHLLKNLAVPKRLLAILERFDVPGSPKRRRGN